MYQEADQRARAKRIADKNYIEGKKTVKNGSANFKIVFIELRKQKEEFLSKRMTDRRLDVEESKKIIFGSPNQVIIVIITVISLHLI